MKAEEQERIFEAVKSLLLEYVPPYTVRENTVRGKPSLELWAEGDFEAFGRHRKEIYFAGLIAQSGYVGFYFMPVYSDAAALKQVFSPQLLACLKGKSCFHLKELDDAILDDIRQALREGFKMYKQRGWV